MADAGGRQLIERIDAMGRFLHVLVGTAALELARPQQVQALHARITCVSNLSLDDATQATEKIKGFTFLLPSEKDDLLSAVIAKASAPSALAVVQFGRKALQDFSALQSYFPLSLWETLQTAETAASVKLERCLSHLGNLGLRNPSEGTMQCLTAVYMLCHDGQDGFDRQTPAMRMATYKAVKAEFKRMAAYMPSPLAQLQALPINPHELKVAEPALWKLAFEDAEPAPAKFTAAILQRAVACIPMRVSRSDSSSSRASSQQQAPAEVGSGVMMQGVLQQFALGMAQQFSMLQTSQAQMMNAMGLAVPIAGPEVSSQSPRLTMIGDVASAEGRFLRRAQSKLALTDSAPSGSDQSMSVPAVPANAVPEEAPAAKEAEIAPPRKSIDEVSASMIAAMDKKTQAAKEAKEKLQVKGKGKAKAQAKGKEVKVKSAIKAEKVKTEPGKVNKRKADDKKAEEPPKNPHVGHEASRNQFMCRTGFKGTGQNVAFQYDPHKKGSQQVAKAKADKWLVAEKKKRGIA